jgi:hypothetical protein
MSDFAISIKLTADGASLASGVKAARAAIDGLAKSAKDASGATKNLGEANKKAATGAQQAATAQRALSGANRQGAAAASGAAAATRRQAQANQTGSAAARTTATALRALNAENRRSAQAANSAATGARNQGRASQEGASRARTFGQAMRQLATQIRSSDAPGKSFANTLKLMGSSTVKAAKEAHLGKAALQTLGKAALTGSADMSTLKAGAGLALGALSMMGPYGKAAAVAIKVVGAAIQFGYDAFTQYSNNLELVNHTIARAGLQHKISADDIRLSTSRIAGDTGQAFEEVQKAQLGLIESGKISAENIDDVTSMGAKMAATFGGSVVDGTNDVADAYSALGEGDTSNLIEKFGFLEQATLDQVDAALQSNDTAKAQGLFMEALGNKVHGGPGSLGTAFGNLKRSIMDWVGGLVESSGIVQWFEGIIGGLARTIQRFATWIQGNVPKEHQGGTQPKGPPTIWRDECWKTKGRN